MHSEFHARNRRKIGAQLEDNSLLLLFAGNELRKTADEYYPFFADRNFLYMTGISQKESILLLIKEGNTVRERLYLLPPDPMAERWTGTRLTPLQAQELSGAADIRPLSAFTADFRRLALSGSFGRVYLDLYLESVSDMPKGAQSFACTVQRDYPYLQLRNVNPMLRAMRTIKTAEEIQATRQAEEITRAGILAMMRASRPGMYEYQYKAEFDHALGQFGPQGPGFPSIISAGRNNFCIHYYSYTGRAQDGDMILNDVGAQFDNHITDVSRGFPCNGRFSEKQKLLYECALETSNHMFSVIAPGMQMAQVDAEIRSYNAGLLKAAGVLGRTDEIGKLMWHGGAHHVGYDVHDAIVAPEVVAPGMLFCVDVGIYHEEWGIGFRLEDNCLVTDTGCENLSAAIPRTVADIEAVMRRG